VAPRSHKSCFRSGVTNAAVALKNYDEAKKGVRKGESVGFPKFKNRHSRQSFTLIEFTKSWSWISEAPHVRAHTAPFPADSRITRRRDNSSGCTRPNLFVASREGGRQASGQFRRDDLFCRDDGGHHSHSSDLLSHSARSSPSRPIVGVDLGVKHLLP